ARGLDGVQLPDTWLMINDVGNKLPKTVNGGWDYNDGVSLLVNARPLLGSAPPPGDASLALNFNVAVPGTVADRNGNGTGFADVRANGNGDKYLPANLPLDTTNGGNLGITSTMGSSSGSNATQQNALQSPLDATRQAFRIRARIAGPLTNQNTPLQQQS